MTSTCLAARDRDESVYLPVGINSDFSPTVLHDTRSVGKASPGNRIDTGIADFQYGYHWWTGTVDWQGRKLRWNAAFGNGGQRLFVVPKLDLTVAMTAGAYGDPQIAPRVNGFF